MSEKDEKNQSKKPVKSKKISVLEMKQNIELLKDADPSVENSTKPSFDNSKKPSVDKTTNEESTNEESTNEESKNEESKNEESKNEESSEVESDSEDNLSEDEDLLSITEKGMGFPRKLGFKEVETFLKRSYYTKQDYYSSAFDIIASYVKGQKMLYMESHSLCIRRLNCLMLPAIFLSALASVMSLSIDTYDWGSVLLASVNAFNAFLLSVVNYCKLDAAAEAHKISSHQYDKLQSFCEFTSGTLMVLPANDDADKKAKEKLDIIETKIKEIKETNGFIIPKEVRQMLSTIYHTNIFALVKKITTKQIKLVNNIKEKLNELRPLEYYLRTGNRNNIERIKFLRQEIQKATNDLLTLNDEYTTVDNSFKEEINKANKSKTCFFFCCC